jgi:hypothetical protein
VLDDNNGIARIDQWLSRYLGGSVAPMAPFALLV